MKKKLLESFISKYNLSGAAESVKWKADTDKLVVHFAADGIGMIGFVETTGIVLDAGEYNIFETVQLRQLLAVLGEDISFSVKSSQGKATAFNLADDITKVTFALSDPKSIPVVPIPKGNITNWDVEFKADVKFRDAFVRGKMALGDAEKFVVMADNGKVEVVIGYEADLNTHNVNISPESIAAHPLKPVHFISAYLKDILMANKEMPDTTIHVSAKGVMKVQFASPEFTAEYYLFQKLD